MSKRGKKAEQLFRDGSNCAQAVFCAYADLLGIEPELAMRLSASFGGGIGRLREVCGCVSGMAMIAGYFTGSTDPADQEAKAENYRCVQELAEKFREKHGTLLCRELLGLERAEGSAVPAARTAQYYAERPCEQLIRDACEILEERFAQLADEPEKGDTDGNMGCV